MNLVFVWMIPTLGLELLQERARGLARFQITISGKYGHRSPVGSGWSVHRAGLDGAPGRTIE